MPNKKKKPLSYKEQRDIWYAKLEKKGFKDIEKPEAEGSPEGALKSLSSGYFTKYKPEEIAIKQTYYQMADNLLNDYKFDSNFDKIVWEYHANGLSIRDIVITLKKLRYKAKNRDSVWKTIKRLKSIMRDMYLAPKKEPRE